MVIQPFFYRTAVYEALQIPVELLERHMFLVAEPGVPDPDEELIQLYLETAVSLVEQYTGLFLHRYDVECEFSGIPEHNRGYEFLVNRGPIFRGTAEFRVKNSAFTAGLKITYSNNNSLYFSSPNEDIPVDKFNKFECFYEAGYGSNCPSDLKNAILIIFGYLYTNRGDCDCSEKGLPFTAKTILDMYKVVTLGTNWFHCGESAKW